MPTLNKLEALEAAYGVAPPGQWLSTGVAVATPVDGGVDYLVRGCHADGIVNEHSLEFISIAHNLTPLLLKSADTLKSCVQHLEKLADAHHDKEAAAVLDQVTTLLSELLAPHKWADRVVGNRMLP